MLRRIIGPKRDKVIWEWRRLHNEELNDLHSSPNNIQGILSRRMSCLAHVARLGEKRVPCRALMGKPE